MSTLHFITQLCCQLSRRFLLKCKICFVLIWVHRKTRWTKFMFSSSPSHEEEIGVQRDLPKLAVILEKVPHPFCLWFNPVTFSGQEKISVNLLIWLLENSSPLCHIPLAFTAASWNYALLKMKSLMIINSNSKTILQLYH